MPLARRRLLSLVPVALAGAPLQAARAEAHAGADAALSDALAALERRAGGRLGVAAWSAARGRGAGHRVDERFALCSTFKLPLAAAALEHCAQGVWRADERLPYGEADRVPHMPVTGPRLAEGGMPLLALAEAAQVTSDNLAANLVLRRLGGPAAFTAWLREHGDAVTRLDAYETALNRVKPGQAENTTTPAAMAATVGRLLGPQGLDATSHATLRGWMVATATGLRRLRAGLPAGWVAGDKTGTAMYADLDDQLNDVAALWPPGGGAPSVIAAYYRGPQRGSAAPRPVDDAVIAEAGRLAAAWLQAVDPAWRG